MGILFGIPNQLVLAALAIGLIVVTVAGYRMWWLRRPRGVSGLRFGRPAPRGAWRRLPWYVLGVGLVATVLVGWFIPLLGLSLLAFLMLDLVIGVLGSRRRDRTKAA